MGYGGYSYEAHRALYETRGAVPTQTLFKQRACHPLMDPRGVKLRECRDSAEHPHALPIVFALDVTGSMGSIPETLARRDLPAFMQLLMDNQVEDPQVLFMAVGDAFSDDAPLQVGQFESTAELMDQWLTWTWLEGKGGPGINESYELALYFAARHMDTDAWGERNKRGYFLMTGDEKPYPQLAASTVQKVIGDELEGELSVAAIVEELSRAFEPFFFIPDAARRGRCEDTWRALLGDRVICMESGEDTCTVAAALVALGEGRASDLDDIARRLRARHLDRERVGAVLRALTPWAATIGKDSAAPPRLDPHVKLSAQPRASGNRRLRT